MKSFAKPYWISLTVTLPQSLIVLYYLGIYRVISSLLEPGHLHYWHLFGAGLAAMIVSASAYAVYLHIRRLTIPWGYALASLFACSAFLFAYIQDVGRLLPSRIPEWMVSWQEVLILPFGLMMPALIHALLLLIDRVTPEDKTHSLIKAALAALAIPTFWYLGGRFASPLLSRLDLGWELKLQIVELAFIILTVAFMFLSMRLTYLLNLKMHQSKFRNVWLLRAPFTLLLPLLSLLVYNGVIGELGGGSLRFIGDWSHPVYYALLLINGVLLTLPPAQLVMLRLGGFAAKVLFYPFVAYFFIVFLPFFPLAIGAVVVGFGFLMLAPLLLFFFHTRSLYEDWCFFSERFGRKVPALIFMSAFAVLPVGVTVSYWMDRSALDTMLTHVYEPDYSSGKASRLDMDAARRVLDTIKRGKERSGFLADDRKPYLAAYYQWLVLDNLTLSDSRLNDLERIFLDSPEIGQKGFVQDGGNGGIKIGKVASSTKPSGDGSFYTSQVELTLTRAGGEIAEYAARFRLPPGAWIQDYYLVIDGKKVPGILAERKSALWLYRQIRATQQDPGILYYTSPNELMLRVFPFLRGESRQTGFTIVHREPLTFTIDGTRIDLRGWQTLPSAQRQDADENFIIVSPAAKATLPKHHRKPYLHFIVDRSFNAAEQLGAFRKRVEWFVANHKFYGIDRAGSMVTVANYDDQTFPLDNDWPTKALGFEPRGGFFLERAVKRALYVNYRQHSDRYPVFVVVSDKIEEAVFTEGMNDFGISMPEGDFFLVSGKEGISTRLFSFPMQDYRKVYPWWGEYSPDSRYVLAWPNESKPTAFLPDDGQASLVIKDVEKDFSGLKLEGDSWENGLKLYGMWMSSRLDPRGAGRKHHAIIGNSFATHLLTPLTAFLAPENDAQRQTLLRKQQQVLSSMRPLDLGEEHSMDEPPLWVLALCLAALLFFSARRRKMRVEG